jgi:hypothetical protein
MADITNPTMDVTIYEANGSNGVAVNSSNELSVADGTARTTLSGIKTQTDKLTFTGTQLQVITTPSADTSASIKNEWQTEAEEGHAFSMTTPIITVSGSTEVDFCLLRNPITNTKSIEFHNLAYTYSKGSGLALLKSYIGSTITSNGTLITNNKMKFDGTSTAGATWYYSPTISARGTLRRVLGASSVGSSLIEYDLGIVIPPGYDLLFTVVPAANNADHSLYLDWAEHTI